MTRTLILLPILLVFFIGYTDAQVINTGLYKLKIQKEKVYKKGSQTFCVVPATFTNLSKDTLKYFSLSCSSQMIYILDNEKIYKTSPLCEKDFPFILKLAPNKSKTDVLTLMIDESLDNSKVSFKVGLNFKPANKPRTEFSIKEFLDKDNVIWSNEIKLIN